VLTGSVVIVVFIRGVNVKIITINFGRNGNEGSGTVFEAKEDE